MMDIITAVVLMLIMLIRLRSGGYHSDSLKVHLSSPEFLPAVMFVTFPLRNTAELSSWLKDVFDQRTTTDLVCWDLNDQEENLSSVSCYKHFVLIFNHVLSCERNVLL